MFYNPFRFTLGDLSHQSPSVLDMLKLKGLDLEEEARLDNQLRRKRKKKKRTKSRR